MYSRGQHCTIRAVQCSVLPRAGGNKVGGPIREQGFGTGERHWNKGER